MDNIYSVLLSALRRDDVERRTNLNSGEEALYQRGKLIYGSEIENADLIEKIQPEPHLVVFGAGHCSKALYDLSRLLSMDFTVLDERAEVCNKDRFPNAELICIPYDEIFKRDFSFYRPYFVIMTHGHNRDRESLIYSLRHPNKYVGMIGSKGKVKTTLNRIKVENGFTDSDIAKVHSPIGLEIGAITPEEIAVSVMAEIISVYRENKESVSIDPKYLDKVKDKSGISVRIVSKSGSAPRGIGSEVFVTNDTFYGTIGGGNVEKEGVNKARELLNDPSFKSTVIHHNLSIKGDLGMICGGDVDLLYQRR